jgi:hypothetical protein
LENNRIAELDQRQREQETGGSGENAPQAVRAASIVFGEHGQFAMF